MKNTLVNEDIQLIRLLQAWNNSRPLNNMILFGPNKPSHCQERQKSDCMTKTKFHFFFCHSDCKIHNSIGKNCLSDFHLNRYTAGFRLQTKKLIESHYTNQGLTLACGAAGAGRKIKLQYDTSAEQFKLNVGFGNLNVFWGLNLSIIRLGLSFN